jgi:hypothetical protein
MAANAVMATSSADRLKATYQPSPMPYNNFSVQTNGGNIIQGQINKIRVCEINFPYNIPTVVERQNDAFLMFELQLILQADGSYQGSFGPIGMVANPRYYTGPELVAEVNVQLAANTPSLVAGWDSVGGSIYLANTSTWTPTLGTVNYVYIGYPSNRTFVGSIGPGLSPGNVFTYPSLAWTMGFKNLFAATGTLKQFDWIDITDQTPQNNDYYNAIVPQGYPNGGATGIPNFGPLGQTSFNAIVGANYSGLYTEYIDVTSPQLCQAQYVRDGNTNQGANHRDIITRLYIADETSQEITANIGRPFQIHRQFKNPKIMKWTAERSIDSIDLQLWDQYGLEIPNAPPQFITFLNAPAVVGPPAVPNLDLPLTAVGYSGSRDYNISFVVDEVAESVMGNY